jgi:acyl carrier protein
MKKFIKTIIRKFLNENNQISNRVDNALDWMNKYDIKISNKTFHDYVEFTNKNYNKIENLVKEINKNGYIWSN